MTTPVIVRITGAVVEARPMPNVSLYELAFVGERRLLSEVIRVHGETTVLQVFEDTTGLCLGEPVAGAGSPLSAQLGPGLLGSLLDGVGRPLDRLAMTAGNFMPRGSPHPRSTTSESGRSRRPPTRAIASTQATSWVS